MRPIPFLLSLSPLLLAGCMEGQKAAPLSRFERVEKEGLKAMPEEVPPELLSVMPVAQQPSLYETLGKQGGIVQIVDDFVAFVIADDDIRDVHKKHFKEGDVAGLKKKLVDQIGQATGGPQKYTGKNMKDAHKGLDISNKDFDALVNDLRKAFVKNKVPDETTTILMKVLESMRADVVEKKE
jgi:hemoglobin